MRSVQATRYVTALREGGSMPVHTGLSVDPARELERLVERLVR